MVTLPSVTLGRGSLCRVQRQKHSAKLKKTKPILASFLALLSAGEQGTRQRILIFSLPSAMQRGTQQKKFQKKAFSLPSAT
jgi:hypothetical protein